MSGGHVWPVTEVIHRFQDPKSRCICDVWCTVDDPRNGLIGDAAAGGYIIQGDGSLLLNSWRLH